MIKMTLEEFCNQLEAWGVGGIQSALTKMGGVEVLNHEGTYLMDVKWGKDCAIAEIPFPNIGFKDWAKDISVDHLKYKTTCAQRLLFSPEYNLGWASTYDAERNCAVLCARIT